MTASSGTFGRKSVIIVILLGVVAMFVTSFVYRMNNPNLFVQGKVQHSADDGHDHGDSGVTPPPGMGQGMNGAMARVKEYMEQVEANPNDVEALINLGNSFLMMRAWDRALEPLNKANELQAGNTDLLKAIGIALFNKQDFGGAAKIYKDILQVAPNDSLALFNLGVIYKHYLEKPEEAQAYFRKVLEVEKKDAQMRKMASQELGE